MLKTPLCQLHEKTATVFKLDDTPYFAVVECLDLPSERYDPDHVIRRGAAVEIGRWFFFTAREPALAFGRAARMSLDCHSYGVYTAARESKYCERHDIDEIVLLVNTAKGNIDRKSDEADDLERFVQAVREWPDSSSWHEPTPSWARSEPRQ
jgi:hypothetical protein